MYRHSMAARVRLSFSWGPKTFDCRWSWSRSAVHISSSNIRALLNPHSLQNPYAPSTTDVSHIPLDTHPALSSLQIPAPAQFFLPSVQPHPPPWSPQSSPPESLYTAVSARSLPIAQSHHGSWLRLALYQAVDLFSKPELWRGVWRACGLWRFCDGRSCGGSGAGGGGGA